MKKVGVGLLLLLLFPVFVFSQKNFEGKIVYGYSFMKEDSVFLTHYYSPGKLRYEMHFKNAKPDIETILIANLDSNFYYNIDMSEKKVVKVILDSIETPYVVVTDSLFDERAFFGFKCYGIKSSIKDTLSVIDSNFSYSLEAISWYARELYFPYQINYFGQQSMIHNNNICLSYEIDFGSPLIPEDKLTISAIKVENVKNADSLFNIPSGFSIETKKISQMPSATGRVTVREITLEEIEKTELPPPPPPKEPKPIKSPAKKKNRNE